MGAKHSKNQETGKEDVGKGVKFPCRYCQKSMNGIVSYRRHLLVIWFRFCLFAVSFSDLPCRFDIFRFVFRLPLARERASDQFGARSLTARTSSTRTLGQLLLMQDRSMVS